MSLTHGQTLATTTPMPAPRGMASTGPGLRMSVDRLQAAIVQHLELRARPGIVWFHVPDGSCADADRGKALGVQAGVPDLLILADAQLYCLAIKTASGRLSAQQAAMHARLRGAGAIVEVAHGIDNALAQLVLWGALKKR